MEKVLKKIALITIGAFIFAIGINYFAIPNGLAEGGIIGITIIFYYMFGWSPGIVNFLLNAVLVAVGFKLLQRSEMIYTITVIILSSFFIWLTEEWGVTLSTDSLLAPLYAGLLIGVGLGIIFRTGSTSGGTTIIALILKNKLGWSMSKGVLLLDVLVIAGGSFVIGLEKTLLTLVSVYVTSKVIDYLVDGLNVRKAVTIISEDADEVLESINKYFKRGVTVFPAEGGYTKHEKKVLYAVVDKREMVRLQRLVEKVDADAFVAIHDIKSAFGGGFS
ncbi:YitT family protein [Virgibacillus sp. W0430]|uniref:YitT family protein n=1 Tax=Virgibacillus sp. W0430 TaxID=3391580 RepID=UPI003F48F3D1